MCDRSGCVQHIIGRSRTESHLSRAFQAEGAPRPLSAAQAGGCSTGGDERVPSITGPFVFRTAEDKQLDSLPKI